MQAELTSLNPTANRPEDMENSHPRSPHAPKKIIKERCTGNVIISRSGSFPVVAKCIDVSSVGITVSTDMALPHSRTYTLEIRIFKSGRNFEFLAEGSCQQSTLAGRDFKVSIKFENIQAAHQSVLNDLLSA